MIALTILGTILKVLLWIILILLLVILGIVLFIIFSPIRYRISGFPQKDLKQTAAAVHITWLLRILGIDVTFREKKLGVRLRITFWKKMIVDPEAESEPDDDAFDEKAAEELLADSTDDKPEEKPEENTSKTESLHADDAVPETEVPQAEDKPSAAAADEATVKPESEKASEPSEPAARPDPVPAENDPVPAWENVSSHMTYSTTSAQEPGKAEEEEKAEQAAKKSEDMDDAIAEDEAEDSADMASRIMDAISGILEKLEGLSPKIDAAVEKVEEKLDWLEDKLNWAEDKLYEGGDYISNPHYQKAVKHVFREIGYILKSLIPQKLHLDLLYSAGNPEMTGKILGISYALPMAQKFEWNLDGDFEAEKFYAEGEVQISGKICIYKILGAVLRLLLDINIWRIVFLLLKLRKQAKASKK